jgi:cation transport regulator ChaC
MAIGDEAGRKTVADAYQYLRALLQELREMGFDLQTLEKKRIKVTTIVEIEDRKEPLCLNS